MEKILIISIVLFLSIGFLFWKLTKSYLRKENGEKVWKLWSSRTYYWQGVIFVATGGTFFMLFILKWTSVIKF